MSTPPCRRLLVICPYPQGVAAGQRLKYEQYLDDWRAQGITITLAPFMDMDLWKVLYRPGHLMAKIWGVAKGTVRRLRDVLRIPAYDIVYLHMYATPFGSSLFERAVRAQAKALIYDIEDNVHVGESSSTTTSGEAVNPNPISRFLRGPRKARYLIRTADHVIASSPFLADECRVLNQNHAATYISSSVDTDRFLPAPHDPARPITIGWTGTFSSRPYLDLLKDVFRRLAERTEFRLRVIGNFDYEMDGVDLEVVTWTAEREVEDLQAIDIGVYPLPIDDWVMGKSGLKAIQYMAFGIPPVATAVGTTPMLIRDGINGLLVMTDDEWVDALERLVKNADLRERLGRTAREDAVTNYSLHAIAHQYRSIIQSVTDKT